MKTKTAHSKEQNTKKKFGIKNCEVKLTRLSHGTISKYIESSVQNCDLYLNIKNGKAVKIKYAGVKIPMTITIESTIPKPVENKYNLRPNEKQKEEEGNKPKKCLTVAVVGAAARKNQLWALAKKNQDKMMLSEDVVVFAKQVNKKCRIYYYKSNRFKPKQYTQFHIILFYFSGGIFAMA